ncbi:MAG TPA: hypothetical protein EYP60_05290 [bacterium (Candidatus Stahlbacteria)]|nr:hypothetical protein [Candidatus Stahlbacteria bacterium]
MIKFFLFHNLSRLKPRNLLITLASITTLGSSYTATEIPKEARGIWIKAYHIRKPDNIKKIVKTAKKNNFNALFVQVVVGGYAYYNSKIMPKSENLKNQPPDFDPLQMMVDEGHKAGLQIHAWINCYVVWSMATPPEAQNHVFYQHPDWFLVDDDGRSMASYSKKDMVLEVTEGMYLNPGKPEVMDWLHSIFMEVARNYDVDGVHFDFVRYPGVKFGWSEEERKNFEEKWGVDPLLISKRARAYVPDVDIGGHPILDAWSRYYYLQWSKERAANVTKLVEKVSKSVREEKPNLQISAAVFPNAGSAFYWVNQAWKYWIRRGLIDIAIPMIYGGSVERVATLAAAAGEYGGTVYAGLGAWWKSPKQITEEIKRVRKVGTKGVVLFFGKHIFKRKGYLRSVRREVFKQVAEIPAPKPVVLATLNGEPITEDDIVGINMPVRDAVNSLINYRLLLEEANRESIKVSDEEIAQYLANIEEEFVSKKELFSDLWESRKDKNDLIKDLEDRIKIIKLIDKQVYQRVKIDSSELVMKPKEVHYSNIFIAMPKKPTVSERAKAYTKLAVLQFGLTMGVSFTELAKRLSENSKARFGGDCGFKTYTGSKIDKIIFSLKEGKVSQVIRTDAGWLIFKVNEIRESKLVPYGELSPRLQNQVFQARLRQRFNQFINSLRVKADIKIME